MTTTASAIFHRVSHWTMRAAGSAWATAAAFLFIAGWAAGGFLRFGFGDHYQMVVNTGTTVVTFLMVFLIQASTNREARATQAKLDALIRAIDRADNRLIDLEQQDDAAIDAAKRAVKEGV